MPAEYNPSFETFDPKDCGQPMIDAVKELAEKVGEPYDSFVGRTLADVGALAKETYPELPDFWRVWHEWHVPQPPPRMGDL